MGPALKRRKTSKVEEVSFDAADREEFLTGFRKRKQQRIKNAQETAVKRMKEEKRQDRAKVRIEIIQVLVHRRHLLIGSASFSFAKSEQQTSGERWKSTNYN
jgi:ribosomal RNA-processing protein 17